jgi:hypothetical protein
MATGGNPDAPARAALGNDMPAGTPIGLPLVVTDRYQNRGWFGDPAIEKFFGTSSPVISEASVITGLCGMRASMQGKCIKVTYTPPAGLTPAPGSFVGSFFLETLKFFHPEVSPTPRPGTANWGYEPTFSLPPGATDVSFFAAAEQPVTVTFRAGVDRDTFVTPDVTETLTPSWKQYRIPLGGANYAKNLIGAFGWLITDLGKPATFYLDGVVWNGAGGPPSNPPPPVPPIPAAPAPPPAAPVPGLALPAGQRDGARQLVVVNKCAQPLWIGSVGNPPLEGGGFLLEAKASKTLAVPAQWVAGRIWARTGCRFDGNGVGPCETGSCGPNQRCGNSSGEPPATLAEFTFKAGSADIYDVSLVDGFNLPIAVAPLAGSFTKTTGDAFDCGNIGCATDFNAACPPALQLKNAAGKVVGCLSACGRFQTDEFCCAGAHNTPQTCPSYGYSRFYKDACPSSYSFAYDDTTSTFHCQGEDYGVVFCP